MSKEIDVFVSFTYRGFQDGPMTPVFGSAVMQIGNNGHVDKQVLSVLKEKLEAMVSENYGIPKDQLNVIILNWKSLSPPISDTELLEREKLREVIVMLQGDVIKHGGQPSPEGFAEVILMGYDEALKAGGGDFTAGVRALGKALSEVASK